MASLREDVERDYEEYKAAGRIWGQVPPEMIRRIRFPRVPKATIDRYLALEDMTTTVADILDGFGLRGTVAASHLMPLLPGRKIAGTAVTLRNIPERKTFARAATDKDSVGMATRDVYYIGEAGDVLVIDFGGNLDISNLGGQSCAVAQKHGFAATVVNGAVRHLSGMKRIGYPVWAKGVTPLTGKHRIRAIEINGPVTVHDILVEAGDLILADDSGMCVVPPELVDPVIANATETDREESKMRDLIEAGEPIDAMRALFRKPYK